MECMPQGARALEMFHASPAFPPSMEVMAVRRFPGMEWPIDAPRNIGISAIHGGRQKVAPCIFCTSAIHGDRMSQASNGLQPVLTMLEIGHE
jgi:hypothetical protein